MKGQTTHLQDYLDGEKITIISFWATWCSPCKKELDNIADLYEEWQEAYNVQVIAVSTDDQRSRSKVASTVATRGWEDYIILLDANQQLKQAFNFAAIPQTFLINKKGEIVYSHPGYTAGDEYELEEKMKELVGK